MAEIDKNHIYNYQEADCLYLGKGNTGLNLFKNIKGIKKLEIFAQIIGLGDEINKICILGAEPSSIILNLDKINFKNYHHFPTLTRLLPTNELNPDFMLLEEKYKKLKKE